jgi:hypothetical protein
MNPPPPSDAGIRSLAGARALSVEEERVLHTDKDTLAETRYMKLALDWSLSWETAGEQLEEIRAEPPGGKLLERGNGFWIDLTTNNWAGSGHPRIVLATQVCVLGGMERRTSRHPHSRHATAVPMSQKKP